jgi:hypothetical protein
MTSRQSAGSPRLPWWRDPAALALLAANLVPLVGVLYFGWSVFTVLLLFWLDNVLIGILMMERLRLLRPFRVARPGSGSIAWQEKNANGMVFGYFFFTVIQGLFLILLSEVFAPRQLKLPSSKSAPEYLAEALQETWPALLAMVASRGFELYADYRRRQEFANVKANEWKMGMNFLRVIVLHVVIIAGGFAAAKLGSPVTAIALLVALKAAGDMYFHGTARR